MRCCLTDRARFGRPLRRFHVRGGKAADRHELSRLRRATAGEPKGVEQPADDNSAGDGAGGRHPSAARSSIRIEAAPTAFHRDEMLDSVATASHRHCERSEAIQIVREDSLDCFAALAMTAEAAAQPFFAGLLGVGLNSFLRSLRPSDSRGHSQENELLAQLPPFGRARGSAPTACWTFGRSTGTGTRSTSVRSATS